MLSRTFFLLKLTEVTSTQDHHHHHHPVCPLKGGRVVSTPLSTLFCHRLCPDPPLSHHPGQSIHRFLGRPLFLVPGSLRSTAHLTNSFSSILFTCPYHLSLLSRIFSLIVPSPSIPALCLRFLFSLVLLLLWWLVDISSPLLPISSHVLPSLPKFLHHIGSPVLPSFYTSASSVSSASVCRILFRLHSDTQNRYSAWVSTLY